MKTASLIVSLFVNVALGWSLCKEVHHKNMMAIQYKSAMKAKEKLDKIEAFCRNAQTPTWKPVPTYWCEEPMK